MGESKYGVVSDGMRRSVVGVYVKAMKNSTLVLAAERTHRKDPLDNFNYYKGGWNISEKHYFSVSFLGFLLHYLV